MDLILAKKLIQKTQRDYDKIAAHFSATRAYPPERMKYFVEKYVHSGMKILDIGCGNGRVTQLFAGLRVDYTGIDGSKNIIVEAKKLFPKEKFVVGDATKLNFPVNTFDLIFSFASFHHIPSRELRENFLKNVYHILKPKKYFICTVWNFFDKKGTEQIKKFNELKKEGKSKLDENDVLVAWKNSDRKTITERYYHGFTESEIKKLFIKTGFKVVEFFYEKNGKPTNNIREAGNLCLVGKK